MECVSYCVAEAIDLAKVENSLKSYPVPLQFERYWNSLCITSTKDKKYYVFKNGTVVSWNNKRFAIKPLLVLLTAACTNPLPEPVKDMLFYQVGKETKIYPHSYFNLDCIRIENNEPDIMLAISYGLSQSIKLSYYERRLDSLINIYTPLLKKLAGNNRYKISRSRIGEIIGEMLIARSELNLISNFFYQPKFFWQHPNLEQYYLMLENYLDIPKRAKTIDKQLNTFSEMFLMFDSYLENKRSTYLELIIIVLIALEIIVSLLNFHIAF